MGRIYQQTFVDTYAKVGFTKLYDVKTAINAADLLNDRVIPSYEEHSIPLCRVLTDRGSEYCGNPERHEYELYLAIEDIDHSRTKTKKPQTMGSASVPQDRAARVLPHCLSQEALPDDRRAAGPWTNGSVSTTRSAPTRADGVTARRDQTFLDSLPMAREKLLDQQSQPVAVAC